MSCGCRTGWAASDNHYVIHAPSLSARRPDTAPILSALTMLRLLRVLHPFPSVLVALLTVVLALRAGGREQPGVTALLGACMLLYQFSIGIANDLVDVDDDRTDKPWKPLAAATISRRRAFSAFLTCLMGGIAVTIRLGWQAWMIGVAGLACGLTYDIWLKRTPLSWVPFSIAFPLVPVWVSVALDSWDAILWWVFPLGFALGFAIHLANQAPDVGAGETGLRGLPCSARLRSAR